jgi:hypothetical protein
MAMVDKTGVLVSGPQGAVENVVALLTEGNVARAIRVGTATGAVGASAMGLTGTAEYVRLSPASRELLARHGAIPGENGFFRMFVHDGQRIAGQLQWQHVSPSAELASSLQVTAVGLALGAAIYDVQQSLERVEAKLDHITMLMHAEILGDALGDHRTLAALLAGVHAGQGVNAADWMTVAPMGPELARSLERLRSHIRLVLDFEQPARLPWSRAEHAQEVVEERWLRETLALLTVVIDNHAMWHRIRLAHIAIDSPNVEELVIELDREMACQEEFDQRILDMLVTFTAKVAEPRVLDGLDPISAKRLFRARVDLNHLAEWFAVQRCLDIESNTSRTSPTFWESVQHIAGEARALVRRGETSDVHTLAPVASTTELSGS